MSPAVNAVNRLLLVIVGLLLATAGGLGLALSFGAFGDARAARPVLTDSTADFADRNDWFWWAVVGGCLLIGLLALWWLLAQTRTERVGHLDLTDTDAEGITTVQAGALTAAVEQEVQAYLGVLGASAGLRGKGTHRVDLTVDLDDTADLAEIRRRLQEQTVPRTRQALGRPDLPFRIELRPATGTTRTIR